MLIDGLNLAPTGNSNYLGYTRHASSCLGVASAQTAESHSLSMPTDSLTLAYKPLELFRLYSNTLHEERRS